MPVFHNPRQVIVSDSGGPDLTLLLAVAAIGAVLAAVVWFVVHFAMVLAIGAGVIAVILAAGTWLLRRYCTVVHWSPEAADTVRRVQAAQRQAIPAPAQPAIAPRRVVPGVVVESRQEARDAS